MHKTILITGASGFVGSHALEALARRGDVTLIAACRDSRKLPKEFRGEVRVGDLKDAGYRQALVQGVDVICLCSAWTSLWGHASESRSLFLEPALALIEAARSAGVQRVINTSTTSAAAPENSTDPMSHGISRSFWPHLNNVIAIEEALRSAASPSFQVMNLRLGIFAGHRYSLGLLPILAPRLKTHLVPWVAGGQTHLPIIDGRDIGQAFALAATYGMTKCYDALNIIGQEAPTVRQVITFLHEEFDLPKPHFSVSFSLAYPFAWLMETLDSLVSWEPLVTRSIIHLMEETGANNDKAESILGYRPEFHWKETVRAQMMEMNQNQTQPMSMAKPI